MATNTEFDVVGVGILVTSSGGVTTVSLLKGSSPESTTTKLLDTVTSGSLVLTIVSPDESIILGEKHNYGVVKHIATG